MRFYLYGLPLSACHSDSVAELGLAVEAYLGAREDVSKRLQGITSRDPRNLIARCMMAYLCKLAGDPVNARKAEVAARMLASDVSATSATPWEQAHVVALGLWVSGELHRTMDQFEALLKPYPTDVLSLRMLHYLYFYAGDARRMRDSVARKLRYYDAEHPCSAFVRGMLAFGLEEAGSYRAAENFARGAVDENPADLWAAHAMVHVLEMEGRHQEGVTWIDSLRRHWHGTSNFRYHLDWHQALFHLAADQTEEALALYDKAIGPSVADDFYLDMANAASLLLRLQASGCPVGDRWLSLAALAERHSEDAELVFASLHYLMPLLAVGSDSTRSLLANMQRWAESATTQGEVAARVGREAARFLVAASEDDVANALAIFESIRYRLFRIGGSRAQRELFGILARDLALRHGQMDWVQAFDAARAVARG